MESNWPVVHTAGKPWNGPGPFEQYVAWDDPCELEFMARGARYVITGETVQLELDPAQERAYRAAALTGQENVFRDRVTIGDALLQGPKLFRPTAAMCEPLEQVAVTMTVQDYQQPFCNCVVEFPEDYSENRIVPAATESPRFVKPGFAVVRQVEGGVVLCLYFPAVGDRQGYTVNGGAFTTGTIEEHLGAAPWTNGGGIQHAPFIRVVLNFLMLAAGGHRLIGPADPAQTETLRKRVKRAKKGRDKDKYDELRTRLRRLPSVYALAQEIKLFNREPPPADPNPDADGTPKTPHWRKGHWRRVAVGAGRTERKLVYIEPVVVNGHLLPK